MADQGVKQMTLPVEGMNCAACVAKLEKAIGQLTGVTGVVANLPAQSVKVKY